MKIFTKYYVNNLLIIHHFEQSAQLVSFCIRERVHYFEEYFLHIAESHSSTIRTEYQLCWPTAEPMKYPTPAPGYLPLGSFLSRGKARQTLRRGWGEGVCRVPREASSALGNRF